MNKFFVNVLAFVFAVFIAFGIFWYGKNVIVEHYSSLSQIRIPTKTDVRKLAVSDLESGKIIIFGSSELGNGTHKFIPYNYFSKALNLPLTFNGHAGHQNFAILSQLSAYSNESVRENARVVIFLSPGWFNRHYAKGTVVASFLEYMDTAMMYQLYFKSDVKEYYKKQIGQYIHKNMDKIKNASFIYKYASEYPNINIISRIDSYIIKKIMKASSLKKLSFQKVIYRTPNFNYDALKKEAKKIAKLSESNKFGIYDEYYNKYVLPQIKKGNFPYAVGIPPSTEHNQEYKDLVDLLDLLESYKIKPLFIMQDLNPYVYVKNREKMTLFLENIKKEVTKRGYGYLDMWSKDVSEYEIGKLTDIMHTGELGWVDIDKKIIEYFMSGEKNVK